MKNPNEKEKTLFILIKKPDFSDKVCEEIILELEAGRKYCYEIVEFIGDKAASRRDIFDLIKKAQTLGYKEIGIRTEADLFYNYRPCKKLFKSGLSFISFSQRIDKEMPDQIFKWIKENSNVLDIKSKDIYPYTKGHQKQEGSFLVDGNKTETKRHLKRIKYFKEIIKKEEKVSPPVVWHNKKNSMYYLIDGFCRYMAFEELGFKTIACLVVKRNRKASILGFVLNNS